MKPRAQRIHEPTDANKNWGSCRLLGAGCLPSLSSTGSGLVFRSHVAVRRLWHVTRPETAGKRPLIPKHNPVTGPRMGSRLRSGISRRVLVPLRQEGPVIPLGASNILTYHTLECAALNRHQDHWPRVSRVNLCPGAWLGRSATLNSVSKH